LANFAWLNQDYAFPEIVSDANVFVAQRLDIHSLSRNTRSQRLQLDDERRIVISPAQTWLERHIPQGGLNTCLVYAGVPVNAQRLQLSLFLTVFTHQGERLRSKTASYFYAEVRRQTSAVGCRKKESLPILFFDRRDLPDK
jgi:hypothetical protein